MKKTIESHRENVLDLADRRWWSVIPGMDADHPLDIVQRLAQIQRASCSNVIGGMLAKTTDDIYSILNSEHETPISVFESAIADQINLLVLLWASAHEDHYESNPDV